MDRVKKAAGISKNVHPHTLRHTFAVWLVTEGEVKVAQQQLGHTTAAFTLTRYGNLLPGKKEAVMDRFEIEHASKLPQEQDEQSAKIVHFRRSKPV